MTGHCIGDGSVPCYVIGVGLVPVHRTVETVPQTEVKTYVDGLFLFPGQRGREAILREFPACRAIAARGGITGCRVTPRLIARIAADAVLISDHAVVGTQFQVGQPGSIRGPRFGRDTPSTAYAPEYTPTVVVVTEFRRTVGTNGGRYIILVVVVVVRTHEVTLQGLLVLTSADTGESASRVVENIVGERIEALDQAVSGLVIQRRGTHPVELVADHSIHMVFAVIVRPVQRLLAVDILVIAV